MATWDAFHPYVLIEVPGASIPLVNQQLCLAAREFCKRTAAWSIWMDPFTPAVSDGETHYFDIAPYSELVRIVRATIGETPVDGNDLKVYTDDHIPTRWHPLARKQYIRHDLGNEQFTIYVTAVGEPVNVLLALMPTLGAPGCGDVLATRYADAIAAKAKANLQKIPGQPFTNLEASAINAALFETAIADAANEPFRRRAQKRTAKVPIA